MKTLIQTSKREITVFIAFPEVLQEIRSALKEANKRRVKLNIAVTPEVMESEELSELGEVKSLYCVLGMLISDMKTLLTMSNWTDEMPMLTQNQNLMRICRDYYDNQICCTKIKSKANKN